MEALAIPAFLMPALTACHDAGLCPSIRGGGGGNNHTVWFLHFTIARERPGQLAELFDFAVRITSSYQKFLDFVLWSGPGFDGLKRCSDMTACIERARNNVDAL